MKQIVERTHLTLKTRLKEFTDEFMPLKQDDGDLAKKKLSN